MKRLLFALGCLFLLAIPGWGHSSLERSEPKGGEILRGAPRQIRLWFTEPIKVGLSTCEVRNEAGKQIDQRDLRADEKERSLICLTLPSALGPGVYKVKWMAVAQDLHVSKGEFSFRVARPNESLRR